MFIYALADPRCPQAIRYVGMARDVQKRLHKHIVSSLGNKTHKANWLKALRRDGVTPTVQVLEECTPENWQDREIFWIAKCRADGHDLTNATIGGDGVIDPTGTVAEKIRLSMLGKRNSAGSERTPGQRERMSQRMLGNHLSDEAIEKIRAALKGRQPTPEERAKMRGRIVPPELRARISAALKGRKHTAEARAKMSASKIDRDSRRTK